MPPSTVLIVEDHEENRALFRTILEHSGYTVVEADHGSAALEMLRASRPDVVVLDLGLPGMDGLEVLRRMGQDEALSAIPVLVLTADVGERTRTRALEHGAREFLTKPIVPSDLRAAVQRHAPSTETVG